MARRDDMRERVRDMRSRGWSLAMIAGALSLSKARVSQIVGELGLRGPVVRSASQEARVARLRALAAEGLTIAQAADRLGADPKSLYRTVRREGLCFASGRTGAPRREIDEAVLAARWLAGDTLAAMARDFRCSQPTVSSCVKRLQAEGVLPRRRPMPPAPARAVVRAAPPDQPAPSAAVLEACPVAALAARRGVAFVSDLQEIDRGAGEYAALRALADRHRVTMAVALAALSVVRAA